MDFSRSVGCAVPPQKAAYRTRLFRVTSLAVSILSLLFLVTASYASATGREPLQCDLLAHDVSTNASKRKITAIDLVRLRDFGGVTLGGDTSPPAVVSPDGRRIALQLRRANPKSNDYCVGIVVVDVGNPETASVVANGGPLKPLQFDKYGIAGLVAGANVPAIIRWSADGQWIAFTRVVGGVAQIWRTDVDGDAVQITHSTVDVDDFQWTADATHIVYKARPKMAEASVAIDREGLSGFRYDGRIWPLVSARPLPASSTPYTFETIDIASGKVRAASDIEIERIEPGRSPTRPKGAIGLATSGSSLAWFGADRADAYGQPVRLHVRTETKERACTAAACTNVTHIWWENGDTVVFTAKAGVANGRTVLYRWRVSERQPRQLAETDDIWFGCQLYGHELICTSEGSIKPRHVVGIDTRTGKTHNIYDPNPELANIALSTPERLTFTNAFGIATFSDLVLPVDRRPAEKLPLIVVQYDSRGFLRGGTGDEFPIQLFAANGFAVLSFHRPPQYALKGPPVDLHTYLMVNHQNWADRRSVLSSLEIGVQALIDRGIADPARIGITGQSDGATTAEFALVHSKMFSAVALSTCCDSPEMMAIAGEGLADQYAETGYPRFDDLHRDFWAYGTLKPNIGSLRPIPILIQAADQEYLLGLQTYEAAREAGWPVEMYVFPGEAHVKVQPAHKLAIYERNVAWFSRWFRQPAIRKAANR